jgi:hypothetical protein
MDKSLEGIDYQNVKLIIAKKIRDDDKETQLKIAFELIAEACIPEGKQFNPNEIKCH